MEKKRKAEEKKRRAELEDIKLVVLKRLEKSINRLQKAGFSEESLEFKIKITKDGICVKLKSKEVKDILEKSYKKIPVESAKNCLKAISFESKRIILKNDTNLPFTIATFNSLVDLACNDLCEKQEDFRKKIKKFFKDKEINITKVSILFSKAEWHVLIQADNIPISFSNPKLEKLFSLAEKIA